MSKAVKMLSHRGPLWVGFHGLWQVLLNRMTRQRGFDQW
jgi:hypothetical protein